MPIIMHLDIMLARRKMKSKKLAEDLGLSEQNISLLKSGKVKGVLSVIKMTLITKTNIKIIVMQIVATRILEINMAEKILDSKFLRNGTKKNEL